MEIYAPPRPERFEKNRWLIIAGIQGNNYLYLCYTRVLLGLFRTHMVYFFMCIGTFVTLRFYFSRVLHT